MFDTVTLIVATPVVAIVVLTALKIRRVAARAREIEARIPPLGELVSVETAKGAGALHYLERGAARAGRRPVVLIHGAGGTLRHFHPMVIEPLAETDRVIAVDRPGAGYSAPSGLDALSLADQAAFLRSGLRKLGVEQPVLVGHSLGGSVALAYALAYADEVSALVLLAPGTTPFTPKPPAPAKPVGQAWLRKALAWMLLPGALEAAREEIWAAVFGPQQAPEHFGTEGGADLGLRPSQIEASLTEQAVYQDGLAALAARYGELSTPVTILFGDADGVVDAEPHIAPLRTAAEEVSVEILPGVGHMLPHSATGRVVKAARAAAEA